MAAAPSATVTSVQQLKSVSATNVRSGTTQVQRTQNVSLTMQESALSVEARELVMHIIVRIAHGWRRIEMGVLRLLIWEVRGRICFMSGESWDRLDLYLEAGRLRVREWIPGVLLLRIWKIEMAHLVY